MNAFHAAQQRYMQNKHAALRKAAETMRAALGVDLKLIEFSRSTLEGMRTWGTLQFDWDQIFRRLNEPDCLRFGIWVGDRLTAAVLATTSGQSIQLRFIEADNREDAPLTGLRILIALEAIANYGQLRGKTEITLEPINEKLISLYEDTYGFEAVRPRKGTPYWRKRI